MSKLVLSTALILASTAYVVLGGRQFPGSLPAIAEFPTSTVSADLTSATSAPPAPAAFQAYAAAPPPPPSPMPVPDQAATAGRTTGRRGEGGPPIVLANAAPPLPAAMPIVGATFKDGTYTGTPADAYFGTVQVRAVISGGRVASVEVLNYPSDRSRSRAINSYALPQLATEVVSAQSASVNVVSGATLTSEAYTRSVAAALAQAKA